MKKMLIAATIGAALVAGQALAADTAAARIGDRIGATSDESSELAGVPVIALVAGAAILAAVVVIATDDDSDSD